MLGPCPVCGGQVPRASIADLADLGGYLQYPDLAEPPEPFYGDPGHHTECTFNRSSHDVPSPSGRRCHRIAHSTPRSTRTGAGHA